MRKKRFVAVKHSLRWVPNSLTLCNSLCGFAAILWMLTAYESTKGIYDIFAVAAVIILGAMVFDVLDGFSARLLDATSMHGLEMDSLADMVTFGVAPATLMAIMTHRLTMPQSNWQMFVTYGLCAVYLGGAALRLATYNVHALLEQKSSNTFHGLPSPGAAAAICSLVLAARVYGGNLDWLAATLPYYAAVLGLLMVSPLPYKHMGKWLLSVRLNQPLRLAALLAALVLVALFREMAIFVMVSLYVISGPVTAIGIFLRRAGRRER